MQKINKLVSKMKIKAFELHRNGQIPTLLYTQICKLGVDTPKEVYEYYVSLTPHFIRIKDYYKKFPEFNKIEGDEIAQQLKKLGFYQ